MATTASAKAISTETIMADLDELKSNIDDMFLVINGIIVSREYMMVHVALYPGTLPYTVGVGFKT